jgi:hypothetical protein
MTKLARGGMAECNMAKGGMAVRKQYPTNRAEPLITRTKAAAAPAPKSDMLYSKKEVNATNLLSEGKAPALPHAKGSVNMKKGGPVKKADGGKITHMGPGSGNAPSATPPGRGNPNAVSIQQVSSREAGVKNIAAANEQLRRRIEAQGGASNPAFQGQGRPMPAPPGNMPKIQGGAPGQKPDPEFLRRVNEERQRVQDMRAPVMQRPMPAPPGRQMPAPPGGGLRAALGSIPTNSNRTQSNPGGGNPDAVGRQMPAPPGGGRPGQPPAMAKGGMTPKQQAKVGKVMGEFKAGELHSGKDGPVVKNRKQAIAIGLSEARKAKK